MKTKLTFFLALFFCINSTEICLAQSANDAYLSNGTILSGNIDGTMHISVSDTNNIGAFVIKLGSTEGADDIFNHTFLYDVFTALPSGLNYHRDANKIICDLGNYLSHDFYFAEVQIMNVNGSKRTTIKFIAN